MVGGRISTGRHHCRFDEKRRKIGHQPAAFACRKTEKARRFERDQELTLIPLRAKLGIGHFGVPRRDAVRRNRFAAFRGAVRGHPDPQAPAMRRPGRPQFDTSTARRVEHPCCDRRHNAGHDLDVDKLALLTVLAVVQPQTTTEIGMPATVDDNFSPARDRMFGRWLCHEKSTQQHFRACHMVNDLFRNIVTGYPTARICWRLLGSSPCSTPNG